MLIDKYNKLLCPECISEYTHLEKVEEYRGKDNRLGVKLHFYCEEEHKFVIDLEQYKGFTYVK